jgi:putative membrane protein
MGDVIAGMGFDDDHMDGGWWWVMGIGWLVFLLLIALLVWLLVRHFTANTPPTGGHAATSNAEEVLAERFARGEIDADEYRQRLDVLREHRSP